jgi:hypothetical protein
MIKVRAIPIPWVFTIELIAITANITNTKTLSPVLKVFDFLTKSEINLQKDHEDLGKKGRI